MKTVIGTAKEFCAKEGIRLGPMAQDGTLCAGFSSKIRDTL